jgi:hypothetical protein
LTDDKDYLPPAPHDNCCGCGTCDGTCGTSYCKGQKKEDIIPAVDESMSVSVARPLSLQFMNVNKIIMTDDHGDIVFEIKSSSNNLGEYFKQFDRLIFGEVVFRREKP